jgi:hypothetical protein
LDKEGAAKKDEDLMRLKSLLSHIKFLKKNSPALEISRNNSGPCRNGEVHTFSSTVSVSKFNFQTKDVAYSNWDYVVLDMVIWNEMK